MTTPPMNPSSHVISLSQVGKAHQYLQFIVRLDHSQTHVIECLLDFAHRTKCGDGRDDDSKFYSTNGIELQQYIVNQLAIKAHVPKHMLHLYNIRQLQETLQRLKTCDRQSTQTLFLSAFTHLPIRGGKGGFGTLLKGQSKQAGARQTTDFGACRDLNGRRLRHINDEIKLQKWRESMQRRAARLGDDRHSVNVQEELQALKTSSGIRNWHLMVPNWGAGEMSNKHRRKEEIRMEREIERWAKEENDKISQKLQKKRELEQLKMDYAMVGMQYRGQTDADEVLSHSILEGMKKRKLRDMNNDTRDNRQEASYEKSHVSEEIGIETVASLELSGQATSQFLCTLSGDMTVQQEDELLKSASCQKQETKVGEKSSEKSLQSITIQSQSEFATAVVLLSREDCHKQFEKSKEPYCHALYYEVTIETGGIAQVGWASLVPCKQGNHGQGFSPNSDSGDGVGDDAFSYGFDGLRGKIFHNGLETDYGLPQTMTPWKKGDIVGCLYDRRNRTISFSVNGKNYGKAFDVDEKLTDQWLSPAISINEKEVVVVNLGPIFCHGPTDLPLPVSFLLNTDSETTDSTHDEKVEDVNAVPDENRKSSVYLDLAGIPLPSHKDSSTAVDIDIKKARVNNCSSKNVDDHGTGTCQDFNLDDYNSPNELQSLGMEKLKQELYKLGCKCGGSLEERANRLFSLKGLERDQIPQKLRGHNFHQVQL